MENKKIFLFSFVQQIISWVMGAYVRCSRNKVALSWNSNTWKGTRIMYLPVHGDQIEPSPIFTACFSYELWLIIQEPVIYFPYSCCINWFYFCSNRLVLLWCPRPFIIKDWNYDCSLISYRRKKSGIWGMCRNIQVLLSK